MSKHLILGGARSGKSRHAENLATLTGLPVTVIVTAEALDAEMSARISRHQADRPAGWQTLEAPRSLPEALIDTASDDRCIVVDCLTLWLSNMLWSQTLADPAQPQLPAPHSDSSGTGTPETAESANPTDIASIPVAPSSCLSAIDRLVSSLPGLPGHIILVANEVGLGLVPETPLGRLFRDEAGRLNQRLASVCEEVTLVAAGLPLPLKR